MGEDEEPGLPQENPSRARRARLLSAAALAVVAIASVAYLRPGLQPASTPASSLPRPTFALDAVSFVSATTGWVLEDLDDFQFAVFGTKDAGRHWDLLLVEPSVLQGEYMRFFDAQHGVVATDGGEPLVYTTSDGGVHWVRHTVVYNPYSFAMSASFSDPLHGWELIGTGPDIPSTSPALMRTVDGGRTWTRLAVTIAATVDPFAVVFADATHGWLDTAAPAPVAFRTDDGGATWRSISLPAPGGGWPVPNGSYFVALRPTVNGGVVASVVNSDRASGRSGIDVLGYPPLTVRTFDGGAPVVYAYSTFVDSPTSAVSTSNLSGPGTLLPAANQTVMRSVDDGASWTVITPPSTGGTMGFAGPLEWWWVGSDAMAITHDGGVSWSPVRIETLDQPVPGSLLLIDRQHAWISAVENGRTRLYATSDGGARWAPVALPSLSL